MFFIVNLLNYVTNTTKFTFGEKKQKLIICFFFEAVFLVIERRGKQN